MKNNKSPRIPCKVEVTVLHAVLNRNILRLTCSHLLRSMNEYISPIAVHVGGLEPQLSIWNEVTQLALYVQYFLSLVVYICIQIVNIIPSIIVSHHEYHVKLKLLFCMLF